jgi:hypothetical protein
LRLLWSHFSGDPLAGVVALRLGDRREDREHQLADTVAGHVAAEVDHVQRDAARLELAYRQSSG